MNLSVQDLTVTGKILFPDGTILNSSYSNLFSGFLNFERNPSLGTTTLLSDKLLVSNNIETASQLVAPSVVLQVVQFLSDLDENNLPVVQSKGFSDALRQQIIDNAGTLQQIIPMIEDIETVLPAMSDLVVKTSSLLIPTAANELRVKDRIVVTDIINQSTEINDNQVVINNGSTGEGTLIEPNHLQIKDQNGDTASLSLITGMSSSDLSFNVSNGIIKMNNNVQVSGGLGNVMYLEGMINDHFEISSPNMDVRVQTGGVNRLGISNTGAWTIQGGSSYNNATNTWTATTFNGTAASVNATSDNTNGIYYPLFTKTNGTGSKSVFIDDVTGPLTYNPSTSTLTASVFSGTASSAATVNVTATNSTNTNYNVNFSTATGGATIRSDTDFTYNPFTNLLTTPNLTASTQVTTPLVVNSTGNVELRCNQTGVGGNIILSGGTGLLSNTSSGNSGLHLVITVNGTPYKIALQNV